MHSFNINMKDSYKNACLMFVMLKETYRNITTARVSISALMSWSQTWAFITTTSPELNTKIMPFIRAAGSEGNQQLADTDIEAEQLTLTFWYGPTKKRWWTYLSTRLVFPTLSFPSITTLASTRIALIVRGIGKAQDETAAEQTGGRGGVDLQGRSVCCVRKRQDTQQMKSYILFGIYENLKRMMKALKTMTSVFFQS